MPRLDLSELERKVKGTGIEFQPQKVQPRLVLSVQGQEFTGNTHFACTAPAPILYQATDFGHEGVIQQFDKKKPIGKAIYKFEAPDVDKKKKWQDYAKEGEQLRNTVWKRFVEDYRNGLTWARTIVWDTATEIWELLRLCHFGKLHQNPQMMYGPVNAEFKDLVREAVDSPKTNLILLHKEKKVYEEYITPGGETKTRFTGKYERAGFNDMGYLVQAYMTARRQDPVRKKRGGEMKEISPLRFTLEVYKSRHNKDAVGMVFGDPEGFPGTDDTDFPTVASFLSPDVDDSAWR